MNEVLWIVWFLMPDAVMGLPDGITAQFKAGFDSKAKCEMFVEMAAEDDPVKFIILDIPTPCTPSTSGDRDGEAAA